MAFGLFTFPTGLLTPEEDGLYADWHEDLMLDGANFFSLGAVHAKDPRVAIALGAAGWMLRAHVYTDRYLVQSSYPQTQMYPRKIELGDVRYYLG